MPTTYDLTQQAHSFLYALEDNGGEITPEIEAGIAAFVEASGDKFSGLRAVYMRAQAEAELHKGEAAVHTAAVKRANTLADRIKELAVELLNAREKLGEPTNIPNICHRTTSTRVVTPEDVAAWPADFVKVTPTLDKAGIKAALAAGGTVPGCRLETGHSVSFKRAKGE